MAEVAVPRYLFRRILGMINDLLPAGRAMLTPEATEIPIPLTGEVRPKIGPTAQNGRADRIG